MRIALLVVVLMLGGCASGQYRISTDLIDRIRTRDDWFQNEPEIIYLALRGDKGTVDRLFRLVPMATRNDCMCPVSHSGNAAAIIIERQLALDPDLQILGQMTLDNRTQAFRYISAVCPIDWTDDRDRIKSMYDIPDPE